jgi:hypothetical protein
MSTAIEFKTFAEAIAAKRNNTGLLPAIEKELLHYEIIAALEKEGFFNTLVFQGGTCLRLCYGADRLSEDLDFAGGKDFDPEAIGDIKTAIEKGIAQRYDVEVMVKEPKLWTFDHEAPSPQPVTVKRWHISVVTMHGRPDIPHQRIKLEVASVPAYTRSIRNLALNYRELPGGYRNILIPAETLSELMADKLVSLPIAKGIRYRDIWDLRWLSVAPGEDYSATAELVKAKLADYRVVGFSEQRDHLLENLPAIINGQEFLQQMERFIPPAVLAETLRRPLFREHLSEQIKLLYARHTGM